MNTDSATVAEKLAPYFEGTELELIKRAIDNYVKYDVWTTTPKTSVSGFDLIQEIMMNAGELDSKVSYEDVVDNSIANRWESEQGK